jgi:hypothetical protein
MARRARPFLAGAVTFALAFGGAPAARAGSLLNEYQGGGIKACNHSAGELQGALGGIPADVEQYAPGYRSALQAALRQRGSCGRSGGAQTATTVAGATSGPGGPGAQRTAGNRLVYRAAPAPGQQTRLRAPAPAAASLRGLPSSGGTGSGTPAPIAAIALLAALVALGGGALALARYLGWGPERLAPARHGLAELGVRVSSATAGAFDWLRVGAPRH